MKPKLLVIELWGIGDLVIATPFLRAAAERYDVTLVAKPYANELKARFWPEIKVAKFVAPWTAFQGKYRLYAWPWRQILGLRHLLGERFDVGLSARWDPRDHLLLRLIGARERLGFPRFGSGVLLTQSLPKPEPFYHRYENWRGLGRSLGLVLPPADQIALPPPRRSGEVLVHTGAGQKVRVWPLERYEHLIGRLRKLNYRVQVACDPDQQAWWRKAGETAVVVPQTVTELMELMDRAGAFLGNDSGPAHLAAMCGVPTFVLFGPQLPEWFAPLHPLGGWIEGKPCPYKPCSDYCRLPQPYCLVNTQNEEVQERFTAFLRHIMPDRAPGSGPENRRAAPFNPVAQPIG